MFEYYALLWLRYRLPIFPIVVYLTGRRRGGLTREEYRARLFGREVLRFRYECVRLSAAHAPKYAKRSAVAAALASLMNRRGVQDPLTMRALMLQRVAESDWDEARKFLLVNMIQTYFPLAPEDAVEFRRLLARPGFREAVKMQVTWADKMIEEGRRAGVLQGKRETLLRQLSSKFGSLPQEVVARVQGVESGEELDAYLDRVLSATSLAEMGLA